MSKISFCLPKKNIPDEASQIAWIDNKGIIFKEEGANSISEAWIYQTWMLLNKNGILCNLHSHVPSEGTVITTTAFLNPSLKKQVLSLDDIFLIDIVTDGLPNPHAHLHLVQNKATAQRLPRSFFMPHWPQPNLIPRDPRRGNRFENVCFFGTPSNIAREFFSPTWIQKLKSELGLQAYLLRSHQWHNYSPADCVFAIRDFSSSLHLHKPATKLYNAWQAGVPFIGGSDSSYAADGHPGKDYLVASSPEELFQHFKRLKEDENFRSTIVKNGLESGKKFTREATLQRWKNLFEEIIPQLILEKQMASTKKRFFTWPF